MDRTRMTFLVFPSEHIIIIIIIIIIAILQFCSRKYNILSRFNRSETICDLYLLPFLPPYLFLQP